MSIDKTLEQRGLKYGDFDTHADISQSLKRAMHSTIGWKRLTPAMKESLDMVQHKIGRILNGDPHFHDSWHDIIGYVRLVEKTLTPEPHQPIKEQ